MYSTIRQNTRLRCDLTQGGIQGGRNMADNRYSEKGIALISVLCIVCLVMMAVTTSAALVTRATQTAAWSGERTKAFYSAEAGLNHWLYEMAKAADSGQSTSQILTLKVTGNANGIPYIAKIAGTDPKKTTYRLESQASTGGRPVKISLLLGPVSGAWRHVVYSTEPHQNVKKNLEKKGYLVNTDLQCTHDSDDSHPVWVKKKNENSAPTPIWEVGGEGYRPSLIPADIAVWSPPDNSVRLSKTGMTVEVPTTGPVYYKDSRIGRLTGNLSGDLYLENCEIGEIDVSVAGNIFARNVRGEADSNKGTKITGDVSGDICLEESRFSTLASRPGSSISGNVIVKNSGSTLGVDRIFGNIAGSVWIEAGGITEDFSSMPSVGDHEVSTTIYGSVYLTGMSNGNKPTILRIIGPKAPSSGATTIHKGVFTQDASVLIEGGVDIRRNKPWPAVLSDGWVILSGAENWIEIQGPVYALANEQVSNRPGWSQEIKEVLETLMSEIYVHEQLRHNVGVIAFGDDLYGNSAPRVRVKNGSIVSGGRVLLVGNVHVAYDNDIFRNPPPWFTGGAGELALISGTWSYSRE